MTPRISSKQAEAVIRSILVEASVLHVVLCQCDLFRFKFGHRPELITVAATCRMALTVDLIKRLKLHPSEAIQEPILIDGVPAVYSFELGETYLKLTNRRIKAELTL